MLVLGGKSLDCLPALLVKQGGADALRGCHWCQVPRPVSSFQQVLARAHIGILGTGILLRTKHALVLESCTDVLKL